jgi:type IV pilus assembly protein PilM
MALLSGGQPDFFGLDIGTTAIRAVQLHGTGGAKIYVRHGDVGIELAKMLSDAEMDRQLITSKVQELLKRAQITSRNVAVNLPSNKVFTAIVDLDRLPEEELAKSMQYQAGTFIPTPMEKSTVDWAVIGTSPADPKKIEVLITSTLTEAIEDRVNMLESIGLNVIAAEPDSMAIGRSLVAPEEASAQMVVDIGSIATDLVVTMNGVPHLTRAIPIGSFAITKAAMQNLGVDAAQANQFVFKFGLSKDKLEGKVNGAILGTVETLMSEVEKSIKFFQGRYQTAKIERIIVSGGASTIPELPVYITERLGLSVEIGNAWRNVSVPQDRYNELAAVSNHFAVAVGLAERN